MPPGLLWLRLLLALISANIPSRPPLPGRPSPPSLLLAGGLLLCLTAATAASHTTGQQSGRHALLLNETPYQSQ